MKNLIFIFVIALGLPASTLVNAQLKTENQQSQPSVQAPSLPESVIQLKKLASKAYAQKKYRAFVRIMQKLHQVRPLDTEYMYQLTLAYSLVDDKTAAYDMMLSLQRQGAAYDFDSTEDSQNIRGTQVYQYVNDMMISAAKPGGELAPVVKLPNDIVLPEAIDWDPLNKAFLIGTVSDGRIIRITESGEVTPLFTANSVNGMWAIYDIKVDAKRNIFWVSSAAVPNFSAYKSTDFGRSALFKFNLKSGRLIKRYPMALDGNPHYFANLALADNGTVYIASSQAPIVYKMEVEDKSPKIFIAQPDLLSIRSIVLNKNNDYLYLSDYSKGLFIINLETGEMRHPVMPETLNSSGIDGMYRWGDSLVVIQNGFNPARVMRLELDEAGIEVKGMAPLLISQPLFDNPNYGVMRGDQLYFFANSHWGLADARGKISADKFKPVQIVRTDVSEAKNLVTPDMEMVKQIMEKRKQQAGASAEP